MDPRVVKRGMEEVREEMREMQREAHYIEQDMERRREEQVKKTQLTRYLPQSLTDEVASFKQQLQEKTLTDAVTGPSTREAVQQRLGGYFDYNQFSEELRSVMAEKDQLEREFRAGALKLPEFKEKTFGKVADYDFSVFAKEPPFYVGERQSFKKPESYEQIGTEPKYYLDYEVFKQEQVTQKKKSVLEEPQPVMSSKKER